jgi:hypothetical protein
MPKRSKYPKLRSHSWRTAGGEIRTAYYYDKRGTDEPDIPLGSDYSEALKKWHEIHFNKTREAGTMEGAFRRWEAEVLPTYSSSTTRRDYTLCLAQIRPVFGPAKWEDVGLPALKQYLKARTAKTRANREMSILQIVWNWARGEGLTALAWPAAGMEKSKWKNQEQAREVDVTPELFDAIYEHADQVLRDAMDINSATGLRITDTRTVSIPSDGILRGAASKTGKRFAISIAESLVLTKMLERRLSYRCAHTLLLSTETGRMVSYLMLRDRWIEAREKAAADPKNKKLREQIQGLILRDMRKMAANLAESDEAARELLQHSDVRTTTTHYRTKVKVLKTVR